MIAILISAVLAQSSGAELGAKIRHESNQMIMRMHNVPYDVADVLNGSNYSVEEATAIAAQRRQQKADLERRMMANMKKMIREGGSKLVKGWAELDKKYAAIANETLIVPDQERPTARGLIRQDIQNTTEFLAPNSVYKPNRNQRIAATNHLKKAEAALAMLDKQGSPPETKKTP
jgi:2-oxo-4-hydroxy-4-carboxy--5-ureidoimidazoline (OHCU) decarboxylase